MYDPSTPYDLDDLSAHIIRRLRKLASEIAEEEDPNNLRLMLAIRDELTTLIKTTSIGMSGKQYSDSNIAQCLGITRQAFSQWKMDAHY